VSAASTSIGGKARAGGSYRLAAFPQSLPSGVLIGTDWRPLDSIERCDVVDPATEEILGSVAAATTQDVDAVLDAAMSGWLTWKEADAWTRSDLLRRVAEILREWTPRIADLLTAEQGKPLSEARAEVTAAADQFDWYADEARRIYGRTINGHTRDNRLLVVKEPIGPVAAFSAWNFPVLLTARKIAPALAAGCSIIVKPAEEAPFTACLVAEACLKAGIPAGVVGVLTGDPAMISSRLIGSEVIRKISLTGSIPVGATLLRAAADRIISASMELGGHAPVLVFADADAEQAAVTCARGKFRNAGQVCASPSRFLVHESVAGVFTAAFADEARRLVVGDGRDPATDVGPLSNRRRLKAAEELVNDALTRGARLAAGGRRDPEATRGFFFQPTVLTDVAPGSRVLREEPFAPVAPIVRFSSLDEALKLANETPFGLASYIFTKDLRTAWLAAEGLEAGMVGINTTSIATAEAPFGGVKQSGFGREGGSEGIEGYLTAKYINIAL
jgi:succinate-semialdehyde dehydrogenase / glutarate-semialdehyde dehydrogenase